MALDLDIRTVEILSEYFGGRSDTADISLRQAIDMYTGEKLVQNLEYVMANSPFYKQKFGEFAAAKCRANGEWSKLPFTTADDLKAHEKAFLCVSPSQISRIVTLETSGTTGKPKRIYFTEEDQQLTVDFFDHGMRLIVDETDTVLILMGTGSPGSIGQLLASGLERLGARSIEYGVPFRSEKGADAGIGDEKKELKYISKADEAKAILELIRTEKVTSIVASPTHMIALARAAEKAEDEIYLRSILLSGEFVPAQTVMKLEEVFQCTVFEHYGMTEMGLGCAVSCGYSRGYHIREADIYIELINPLTGELVEEVSNRNTPGFSNYGEIVFSTLTRKGMPFIRYRTGDFSRWILGDCPCGSSLKRLDKVVPGDDRIEKQKEKENV